MTVCFVTHLPASPVQTCPVEFRELRRSRLPQ
jgi:hypothetical protein